MVNLNLVYMHSRLGVSAVSKKWRKFGTKEMNRLNRVMTSYDTLFFFSQQKLVVADC